MPEFDFKHLAVRFFNDSKLNKRKTAEQGRAIYDDIEMVEIRTAGDPKSTLVAPANGPSSVRHPDTNQRLTYAELHEGPYEAFKKGQKFIGSGTPLKELPFLTEARRKELEAANVYTAEALAGLDGTPLQRLGMGARELKNQAQAWLDKAAGTADATKLAAENAALSDRITQLEAMMNTGVTVHQTEVADADIPTAPSPFEDWDDDTIRLWIEEQGGKAHHKAGHDKLVQTADELNAQLAKASEAA
jgi:hypothetical protein